MPLCPSFCILLRDVILGTKHRSEPPSTFLQRVWFSSPCVKSSHIHTFVMKFFLQLLQDKQKKIKFKNDFHKQDYSFVIDMKETKINEFVNSIITIHKYANNRLCHYSC